MAKPSKFLRTLSETRNWKLHEAGLLARVGRHWFGVESTSMTPDNLVIRTTVVPLSNEAIEKLKAWIGEKTNRESLVKGTLMVENGSLVFVTAKAPLSRAAGMPDAVANLLAGLAREFDALGLEPACHRCAASGSHAAAALGGRPVELCDTCFGELSETMAATREGNRKEGSYLTGFFGALAGGIVGIVPWILIGQLGFIAALAGLIMAFLADRGYRLFRGRIGRGMPWIVLGVLLVSVVLATFLGISVSLMLEDPAWGFADAILLPIFLLAEPDFLLAILKDLGLGILFAGLGSFGLINNMRKEGAGAHLTIQRI